ncbi:MULTISPECIES: hypothetical protein [unclassified Frigoribacterium]|jgi:hypothetical protein|uniref:hypothetical protein n=1 Tax=unclassified Frigoribacterium TaxID=2627005 RepID=UPI0006F6F30A|nr:MULTISPECIES: hypothetical protein [unclassified Frigoribacterium]KQN41040.1 hypothetical protein ASE87_08755 [Frigoribacterium sp. Leaf44]MBD8141072.1 hypothetical protein [Frigoribacterium sp. CFBP 13605]
MTTIDETRAALTAEGLDRLKYVIGSDGANETDCLVLCRQEGGWVSFSRDERAAVMSESVRTYSSESEALDDFLELMRLKGLLATLQRERDAERLGRPTDA